MKSKLFILFLLIGFLSTNAQVTIGSDNVPTKGVLLDLKQYTSDNSITSTKGFGLPRVNLLEIDTALIMPSTNFSDKKEEHIGNTVYNMFDNTDTESNTDRLLCPGIYVWEGSKWTRVQLPACKRPKAVYSPNSYIVSTGVTSQLEIPVGKAYLVWEQYGAIGKLPKVNLNGELTVEIYWQEGAVVSAVSIEGKTRASVIKVSCTGNKGNAVIALKIGGIVRWSWHIWASPDVKAIPHNGALASGGAAQLMDRYLGATAETNGTADDLGLFYQFGRKDPLYRPKASYLYKILINAC